jgi:ComEC/Rec2-related protein
LYAYVYCFIFFCFILFLRLFCYYYSYFNVSKHLFSAHSVHRVTGCVSSLLHCTKRRCGFDLSVSHVDGKSFSGRIHVYDYARSPVFIEATCWVFSFKSYQAHAGLMQRRLWAADLMAKGAVVVDLPIHKQLVFGHVDRWLSTRLRIEKLIRSSVHNMSLSASLSALTVGARNLLSTADWRVYQRTGTSHLVAVSGLHCGIIFSLCYFLMFRLWALFFSIKKTREAPPVARCLALIFTYLYACLVGMSVPTQRAWLMLMWACVPGFFHIETPLWRRIVLAMVIIVFSQPGAIFRAGFWLSFFAVIWLAYVLRARTGPLLIWQEWGRLNLAVNIGLLPLTLYFFHRVSLIAILTNLFAVPWMTLVIVPGCLLATLLSWVSKYWSEHCFYVIALVFRPLWDSLTWCAHLHWAVSYGGSISLWHLCIALFGIAVFLSPFSWSVRVLGLGYLSLVIK